ncbi:Vacuolar protein sorting-associated protein 52-like [Hondaea fermentalgiana]|uniref:Vacuolar protein sorting-associated protein 52-like n=1 Tax=Hondaea fermentalgiana TaxID=2315210 RepID=A0A2R5GFQ0_9STRA|nr:Vacuolar protein sorting-associated protein 52-like [Hondaea fermentalgiana]|eukprot:GBG28568.1 Vacuolar protein sorting-associated protein 52-like [Hondaea fermentalgiana]
MQASPESAPLARAEAASARDGAGSTVASMMHGGADEVYEDEAAAAAEAGGGGRADEDQDDFEFDLTTIEEDLARFQEDEVVRDALARGVDLRSYSRQIDGDLRALQSSSIPEFVIEAPVSAELYRELTACDEALAGMENVLLGFQADLGGISDEIRHLQDESLLMSVKLKNRRAAEEDFCRVLENLIVPETLIVGICQGEVNEDYVLYVQELSRKMKFVRNKDPVPGAGSVAPSDMQAVQDVEPQLEKLRLKAVAKVRQFLLDQINALKKPKTNVQVMQQNVLLKFKVFMTFLAAHAPAVAEEVRATYVDAMTRILYSLFKSYTSSLLKLQVPGPVKEDVIGAEETVVSAQESNVASPFGPTGLGQRESELGEPDAPPIISHLAKSRGTRFHFECIFRSVQKHLMDSATSEFLFILEFFDARSHDLFNQIFAKTLSLCLEHVENFLYSCNDPVALLLMIRTTQSHRLQMERRRVPVLDGYFDHVGMMLWPQFKKVFDANLRSLRAPALAKLGVQRLSLQPHYVSLRYARFTSSVYAISTSLTTSDDMLPHHMSALRQAYLDLLDKLVIAATQSRQHHRALETSRGKLVFRINNLDAVISYFSKASHSSNPEDYRALEELLLYDVEMYIEEELAQVLGPLVAFVKERGAGDGEEDSASAAPIDETKLRALVQDISSRWRATLEQLHTDVQSHFSASPATGRDVLQRMFAQYCIYYSSFRQLASKFDGADAKLVDAQVVMNEMKRFGHMSRNA